MNTNEPKTTVPMANSFGEIEIGLFDNGISTGIYLMQGIDDDIIVIDGDRVQNIIDALKSLLP